MDSNPIYHLGWNGCSCNKSSNNDGRYKRFGDYSKAGEFVYDHPFQWGSKRTGPDLAREGGNIKIKKSNFWHYQHMIRPKDISNGSIMPAYPWLKENDMCPLCRTKVENVDFENLNIREDSIARSKARSIARARSRARARYRAQVRSRAQARSRAR